jgi:hypothetical protein
MALKKKFDKLPLAIVALAEALRDTENMLARATMRFQNNPKNPVDAWLWFTTERERRNKVATELWRRIVGEKEIASDADQRLYLSLTLWANQEAIRIHQHFAGW